MDKLKSIPRSLTNSLQRIKIDGSLILRLVLNKQQIRSKL
jgi:hypothetical protein